jgi:hypothetical protein
MNARRAITLAPVGWFLMIPPVSSNGRVDSAAPLRNWWHLRPTTSVRNAKCSYSAIGAFGKLASGCGKAPSRLPRNSGTIRREILKKCSSEITKRRALETMITVSPKDAHSIGEKTSFARPAVRTTPLPAYALKCARERSVAPRPPAKHRRRHALEFGADRRARLRAPGSGVLPHLAGVGRARDPLPPRTGIR